MMNECSIKTIKLPFTGREIESDAFSGYVHLTEVSDYLCVTKRTVADLAHRMNLPMKRKRVGTQFAWAVSREDADRIIEEWWRVHV